MTFHFLFRKYFSMLFLLLLSYIFCYYHTLHDIIVYNNSKVLLSVVGKLQYSQYTIVATIKSLHSELEEAEYRLTNDT